MASFTAPQLFCIKARFAPVTARLSAAAFDIRARTLDGAMASANHLGTMLLEGRGVERDVPAAAVQFRAAAAVGHAEAQHNLARLLEHGREEGVPQDDTEAAELFRAAAVQGHADAAHAHVCTPTCAHHVCAPHLPQAGAVPSLELP